MTFSFLLFQYITHKYYHTSTPYSIQFSYYNQSPPILLLRSSTQLDSSLLANDKKFQFAYDSDNGSYGYLVDGVFKSFSDATGLYEALQYSGLVTADMSYDQMLTALKNAYPAEWNIFKTTSSDWAVASGSMSFSASSITIIGNKKTTATFALKNPITIHPNASIQSIFVCYDCVEMLEYAIDSTNSWTTIFNHGTYTPSGSTESQTVNLSAYSGKKLYLRFRFVSGGESDLRGVVQKLIVK